MIVWLAILRRLVAAKTALIEKNFNAPVLTACSVPTSSVVLFLDRKTSWLTAMEKRR